MIRRTTLAWSSVAGLLGASFLAIALSPAGTTSYLVIASVASAAFAIQAAISEPKDLLLALLLCLAPVLALVGEPSPSWLVGPLAAVLLLGAELNVLGWASLEDAPEDPIRARRLADAMRLVGLGAVGGLALSALTEVWRGAGVFVFLFAAGAVAALGWVVFPGSGERRNS